MKHKKKEKENHKKKEKNILQKTWYFIWEDDSILSWIVNVLLAFIIVKFIIYPLLGFLLGTTHPIVAVVSGSMEHNGNFDNWWERQKDQYYNLNITKDEFNTYPFSNGFNTGDIMILRGKKCENIKRGDILIFWGSKQDPIIHRVVITDIDNKIAFRTKGDANYGSNNDELIIPKERVVGYSKYERCSTAVFRIPYLGYIKMIAVSGMQKTMNIFNGGN
jgi:signal peptidase I